MRSTRPAAVLLVQALALQPALAVFAAAQQTTPERPAEIPTFGVGTAAVTLDVVVRDKKGNAVHGLTASDFEIYEDGVRQQVASFQVFGRPRPDAEPAPAPRPSGTAPSAAEAPAAPQATAAQPAAAESESRPQVIAFVFDRLSPDARHTAHKAALTYLTRGHVQGDLVGVFALDLALRTVQPFTTDAALIRAGLQRAASQANTGFGDQRAQTRDLLDASVAGAQIAEGASAAPPSGPGAGTVGANLGAAAASGSLTSIVTGLQAGMLRNFEALERDQQGYATTNGLLAVVSGLKDLPGRKTVVFFSEGMAIPPNVQAQFRSVIHTANRANVSVYAMDAAGLRAESMNAEVRREMQQAQQSRLRELESGRDSGGIMTRGLERNEDLLRLHPESGLGQLASETGGFFIRDTNDAASAFRRIEEDMRFHYLLGYSPSNENYDGRFRSIAVKVTRPGLQVQTRQGYYAVRSAESAPLRSFEAPALAQLDRPSRPREFAMESVALSFPTADRPGLAPVLVRIPGSAVAYLPDTDDKAGRKMHRADFTVVARVKDEAGREVDRLSQHYALSAAETSLEAARRGEILFYREADLRPGRYTVEAVAYDAQARKATVSTSSLEVPPVQDGRPRLSSLVLVGRAEKVPSGEERNDNPLFFGETILYPNMGQPFRKSVSPALGFFFTVYGATGAAAPRQASLEVYRDGALAGQVTADLPAPDGSGRIQYAGALPLQGFSPGSYVLKVTAGAGAAADSRRTPFTVVE
jgi:VWFA-related protein